MLSLSSSTVISFIVTNPLLTPSYVNNASVTVTIKDSDGVELAGEPWPIVIPYKPESEGLYVKTFEPLENLVEGEIYSVIINVNGADGLKGEYTSKEKAKSVIL